MKLIGVKNYFAALTILLSLVGCGSTGMQVLPDDPDSEPSELTSDIVYDDPLAVVKERVSLSEKISKEEILKLYDHLDPSNLVPTRLLEPAVLFYHNNKATFKNTSVLTIIDFSLRSSQKRMFIINMASGKVWALHVAHGKGSDSNGDGFAEKFSNTSGSNASSIGFYKTAETYQGKHGLSLRLDGLSNTNSNVRSRAVVVHGADYVRDSEVIQGRSWGCPAVSMANRDQVINLIKGGSLIYANK